MPPNSNNPTNVHTDVVSRPRTIIRMISSKFSPRPPPPPLVELSNEQRDAALRARGLVPQQPPPPPEQTLDEGVPSAADIVKQQWAAKNEVRARERLHSFKFGGPSHQVSAQKQLPSPPSSPVLDKPDVPSKIYSPPLRALPTPPDTPQFDGPNGPFVTLSPSPPTISLTPPVANSNKITSSTSDKVPDDAFHNRTDSFTQLEASISSIATPSTDSSPQVLRSAASLPTLITVSGGTNPKSPKFAQKNLNGLQLKVHEGPSVPILVESPVDLHFAENPVVIVDESVSKALAQQDVVVVEEEDKDGTRVIPLVPVRKTTTVISTATAAATPSSPQRSLIASAPKSPTTSAATPDGSSSRTPKRGMTDPTSGVADGKRKITNPFKRGEHKSAGKVVDDAAVGVVIEDETPKARPRRRRLTMGSSLSNLRRSFVGSLSRPSNSEHKNIKGFDASHLPPSPTIPSSFNVGPSSFSPITVRSRSRGGSGGSSSNEGRLAVPPLSPRVCQNIAMHNHGTIQTGTAAIEDDETRRMTELAFLG